MELDGDTAKNVEAFEAVVRCMHDCGVGYGSINHPVDRDPICGYVGGAWLFRILLACYFAMPTIVS